MIQRVVKTIPLPSAIIEEKKVTNMPIQPFIPTDGFLLKVWIRSELVVTIVVNS